MLQHKSVVKFAQPIHFTCFLSMQNSIPHHIPDTNTSPLSKDYILEGVARYYVTLSRKRMFGPDRPVDVLRTVILPQGMECPTEEMLKPSGDIPFRHPTPAEVADGICGFGYDSTRKQGLVFYNQHTEWIEPPRMSAFEETRDQLINNAIETIKNGATGSDRIVIHESGSAWIFSNHVDYTPYLYSQ